MRALPGGFNPMDLLSQGSKRPAKASGVSLLLMFFETSFGSAVVCVWFGYF